MRSKGASAAGDGKRLLLLWLSRLVLLALLLAAGAVVFDAGPRAPLPVQVGGVETEPPPASATPDDEPMASERQLAVRVALAPAAPPAGPTFAAQCRLACSHSQYSWRDRFLGACTVLDAAGACLAELHGTADPRPLAFALPVAIQQVRFTAPGYQPAERDVPPLREGVLDFGTVVLEPDAAVRLRIGNAPDGWAGRVHCTLQEDQTFWRQADLEAGDFAIGTVLPCPSGRALTLRVASNGGKALQFAASLPPILLSPGETRDCAIDVQSLQQHRIRVVGPSRELLRHLWVRWQGQEVDSGVVVLDADGCAELRGLDPAQLSFAVDPPLESGALQPVAPATAVETALTPTTALVGLRLRGADGEWVAFEKGLGHGTLDTRQLRVMAAAQLDASSEVRIGVVGLGTLCWPVRAIVWQGDIGTLDVGAAVRVTGLVVTPVGKAPEQAHRIRLQLRAPDGATRVLSRFGAAFAASDLVPGTYSLRWQIGDQPGPAIDDALLIAAGKRTELQVPWPAFAMWQGTVTNWRSIPVSDRFHCVRFGTWKSFADGAQPQIDDDGHFLLPLPEASLGPDARIEFRSGVQGIEGRVVAVDVPGHRVMVEHPAVRFVELRVQPKLHGDWMLMLHAAGGASPSWATLNSTKPARVLLPRGMVLHGELCESEPGGQPYSSTTAFVTIDGSSGEVTVAPAGGHECVVRLQRDAVQLQAYLLDPQGNPCGFGVFANKPGEVRLWVPDGANGIEVRLEPGGVQHFDAAREAIAIR